MQTYETLAAFLANGRDPRSRPLENNTRAERRSDTAIAVRLHATDVLTFHADGRVVYDSGGWRTVTTKARMNAYGPGRVWTERGTWYFTRNGSAAPCVYADGLTVRGARVTHAGKKEAPTRELKLRKRVARYVQGYMTALHAGKVPAPGAGDCLYCAMTVAAPSPDAGKALGEVTRDASHIRSHIAERYYVPALLVRALKAMGASQSMWWYLGSFWDEAMPEAERMKERMKHRASWEAFERPRVAKALRRYMLRELGLQA